MAGRRSLIVALAWGLLASVSQAQSVVHDVIYAKQGGAAFTMDVFKPEKQSGQAVICVISGGWFSRHEDINPLLAKPFVDKGMTVFEVVHGSQPKYIIPEILGQLQRAVRYIRYNATTYGIQPNEIGVMGISSGGHLSLMLGGLGGPGDPNAKDPVDRASSSVNAVVDFFGPTDFLDWGETGKEPYGDPKLAIFMPAFGINAQTPKDKLDALAHDVSPVYKVGPSFPPTLIVHGDKDPLVPLEQSQVLDAAMEKSQVKHRLLIVPGGAHDAKTLLGGFPSAIEWLVTNLKP